MKGRGSLQGEPRVRFIQIGSISGQRIQLSAEWLRSSGVQRLGSGLGSTSMAEILASMRAMFDAYVTGGFHIETPAAPLADVTKAWSDTASGRRTVFTMA